MYFNRNEQICLNKFNTFNKTRISILHFIFDLEFRILKKLIYLIFILYLLN